MRQKASIKKKITSEKTKKKCFERIKENSTVALFGINDNNSLGELSRQCWLRDERQGLAAKRREKVFANYLFWYILRPSLPNFLNNQLAKVLKKEL